ncbi:Uncharacterised protein [Klebsiella pneumoniae]|nr:Uncharacterised protein [Klebsiella pneumoniae]
MLREFAALSMVCCASARLLLSVASVTQAVVKSAIIVSRVFCAVNSLASQVSRAARDRLWFLPNKSSSKLETAPSACEAELRPLATVLLRVWLSSASTVGNSDARVSPYWARAASISASAFCTSRLLLSAMLTTFFSRASLTTFCQSPTTAVDSPCAPGRVAGTGAAGRS